MDKKQIENLVNEIVKVVKTKDYVQCIDFSDYIDINSLSEYEFVKFYELLDERDDITSYVFSNGDGYYIKKTKKAVRAFEREFREDLSNDFYYWFSDYIN